MMKTRMLIVTLAAMMSMPSLFAQDTKTEKFKVAGNCGMCEKRIENVAKSLEGVSFADWDKETKMLEVTFDSEKTNLHKIHKAIADVGHDTEMHRASDEVYNNLPACCRYDRMKDDGKQDE
jgi:copper chaperone CopZ